MADDAFEVPRLAAIYDVVDGDRSDLDLYAGIAAEFGARSVLDVGCGTGTLACLLAARGITVTAIDPALASLDVARAKPGADRVRWLRGDATRLPPLRVDLVVMTGNVAQAIAADEEWAATLAGIHAALRPGGRLVFETRDPDRKAWLTWNPAQTLRHFRVPGAGEVTTWSEVTHVSGSLVSFRSTYEFPADGTVLTSDSTIRFRRRDEVTAALSATGFTVDEVRDAPDRPGMEMVFVASRAG